VPWAGGEKLSASLRIERCGSISFANSVAVASDSGAMSGNTAPIGSLQSIASVAMSQTKAACPREARMDEIGGGAGVTFASIRDRASILNAQG